ncbi:hypothetical protein H5410_043955 [Solanum commersonii]|uniref:DUF1664 domain-containing protein n=1 Tax=Solanum commersonii TaxID=4109 RepID=A0A9J5XZ21_SOLCO|nr:hypothetical protein H5410_043955 [Solanum commersonii]
MAMQAGVATSKVLILVGAGLTGSVILKSGRLSDLISQLQEVINGVNAAETSPGKYDTALLAAQIRQLAQEIREMSISNPITIFNKDSSSSGSYGSYILPAAAVGAMGYCYMKWKASIPCCSLYLLTSLGYFGWSFSDVMYVTKHNMANAVASVSKQLENVSDALAVSQDLSRVSWIICSTRRHLTKRLENLDWKLDEQIEISNLITNDVRDVKANLNQIGFDINLIHEMVSGLEGKIELLESNQLHHNLCLFNIPTPQDVTNSGLWYLCQAAGGIKDVQNTKVIQMYSYFGYWNFGKGIEAKLIEHSKVTPKENSVKGLEFIVESNDSSVPPKSVMDTEGKDIIDNFAKGPVASKMRIHRSYPVGLSLTRSVLGPGF